jgi:hypothetical protein
MTPKNPAVQTINTAVKFGVGTTRFRITKEQVAQLREAEKLGHDEAIKTLLGFLRTPRS